MLTHLKREALQIHFLPSIIKKPDIFFCVFPIQIWQFHVVRKEHWKWNEGFLGIIYFLQNKIK